MVKFGSGLRNRMINVVYHNTTNVTDLTTVLEVFYGYIYHVNEMSKLSESSTILSPVFDESEDLVETTTISEV